MSAPDFEQLTADLPDGKWVSTVRLPELARLMDVMGASTVAASAHPFETMVFPSRGVWSELDMARYHTAEEAREGHERMVAKWKALAVSEEAGQ